MKLLFILLIPLLAAVVGKFLFRETFTLKEIALQVLVCLGVGWGFWHLVLHSSLQSVEYWNGRVVSKDRGNHLCCHSRLICAGTNAKGQCMTYVTVYDHAQDYFWNISYSTGDVWEQTCMVSNAPPKAWHSARRGDAASIAHNYTDPFKASPDSVLMGGDGAAHPDVKPQPQLHGIYRHTKVLSNGVEGTQAWNEPLMNLNADLGAAKEVDLYVYFITQKDNVDAFTSAVRTTWRKAPKNGLIIVAQVGEDGDVVQAARVESFSDVHDLRHTVETGLPGVRVSEPEQSVEVIRNMVQRQFKRTPASKYEHLLKGAEPPTSLIFLVALVVLLLSVGLVVLFHFKDIFGGVRRWLRRR